MSGKANVLDALAIVLTVAIFASMVYYVINY